MDKENKGKYSIQIILACLGAAGIMGTLLSCVGLSSAGIAAYAAVIVSAVFWVICMNKKPEGKKIMAAAGILLLLIATFSWKMLYTGTILIINAVSALFQETGRNTFSPIVLKQTYTDTETAIFQSVTLIFLGIFISFVVSLIVVYIRSMGCAIISILPFILIFMAYNVVPAASPLLMCLVYVFGVAALKRKGNDYYSAKLVVVITIICAIVCVIIVSPVNYKSPDIFNVNWVNVGIMFRQNVLDRVGLGFVADIFEEELPIEIGDVTGAMTNAGKLGNVDFIQHENINEVIVYTQYTDKTQYIARFHGGEYLYGYNRWQSVSTTYQEYEVKLTLLAMIEYNQILKDYIDNGSGDYSEMIVPYQYNVSNISTSIPANDGIGVQVNEKCFEKFKAIADREKMFNLETFALTNRNQSCNQYGYSKLENEYRKKVYENYLDIPKEHKELISSLLGDTKIETHKQKMNYITKVKKFLKNNYEYTLSPGKVPRDVDFLEYFLTENKRGYCTYFATAATVMFRAAGIPARYVEGYVVMPQQIKESRHFEIEDKIYSRIAPYAEKRYVERYEVYVPDHQAHAWVEVYMDGFGWIPVEVTPPYEQQGVLGTSDTQDELDGIQSEDDTKPQQETEADEETENETSSDKQQSEASSENSSAGIGSGTFDFSKWFADIKKFIDKNYEQIIIWAAVIITVTTAMTVGLCRYSKKTKQLTAILKCGDVVQLYSQLERLLSYTQYKQPDSMAYEYFADYMEQENEFFKVNNFKKMTNIALKARFGGENTVISEAEEAIVRNGVVAIRESLLESMSLKMRIWIKYFVIL